MSNISHSINATALTNFDQLNFIHVSAYLFQKVRDIIHLICDDDPTRIVCTMTLDVFERIKLGSARNVYVIAIRYRVHACKQKNADLSAGR